MLLSADLSSMSALNTHGAGVGQRGGDVLVARCDNVPALVALLAPLVLDKKCLARVELRATGLVVTTEQGRTMQASSRLERGLFAEWSARDAPDEAFVVALATLVECLQVFGRHAIGASVRLAWKGYGQDLVLVVHEGSMRTECALRTFEPDAPLDLPFRDAPVHACVTVDANSLHDAFAELDHTAAYVTMAVDAQHLRLTTVGSSASSQVDYARDSALFDGFESHAPVSAHYKLSAVAPAVRALSGAAKCRLRVNARGVLELQQLVRAPDGTAAVVEFVLLPSLGADEEEADGEQMDVGNE